MPVSHLRRLPGGPCMRFVSPDVIHGNADLCEQVQVGIAVDLDILLIPIKQARKPWGQLDAFRTADDDRMRISLDDLIDFAFD